MSKCCNHTCKLSVMIAMVMLYFLVELIAGYILNSIALVADAFHMLSDFLALIVGVAAHRIGKWPRSDQNTFGWKRAEVVGTQVNTVMLATLTFTIFIDCIKRFAEPVSINNPKLLLWVGSGGLLINIIGLLMLHDHAGHSHGGNYVTSVSENFREVPNAAVKSVSDTTITIPSQSLGEGHGRRQDRSHGHSYGHSHGHSHESSKMNTKAVFLHVLSDFFGSVAVVISALVLWLVPNATNHPQGDRWKLYIDPIISLIMVILILVPTIPLLRQSTLILLQSVPKEILMQKLKEKIVMIDGVHQVHDLHVWLLHSDVIIGTVHICCSDDFIETVKSVKKIFHDFNIHCTTIQMERSANYAERERSDFCVLMCNDRGAVPDVKECTREQLCCPVEQKKAIKIIIEEFEDQTVSKRAATNQSFQTEL